jgi:hypothetical protein
MTPQGSKMDFGYVDGRAPRDRRFPGALEEVLESMRSFLVRDDWPT